MSEPALGFLLQHLRNKRGLSLRELSQLTGVDHAYIHRLETGAKESPSKEVLSKLIRALKVDKREVDMLRYLAEHTQTDSELVGSVLADKTITYEVFVMTAGASFRGTRPDYPKLIERVRRFFGEENGPG